MFERITSDQIDSQPGHVYRYQMATEWLQKDDVVLDVASGIGYGAEILTGHCRAYIGADKIKADPKFYDLGNFISGIDLNHWTPDFVWDVSVSFETLEHVEDPERLAFTLKMARRLIILSTPTRPTKHLNQFHLHDFTVDDVLDMFSDRKLVHMEDQPSELSHIFVFGGHDVA